MSEIGREPTGLTFTVPPVDVTRPEREPRRSHRHDYGLIHRYGVARWEAHRVPCRLCGPTDLPVAGCIRCGAVQDPARSRRGRQSRNYGNRAELDIARKHGGRKVGHAGGPADVLGATRKLQVKSTRRRPPAMWRDAFAGLDSIADSRLAVLLLRFLRPGNLGPEDFYVVRAADFLAWYGTDGDVTP